MPWKPGDAQRHTKKADTPEKQRTWSRIANNVLQRSGSEGMAVRVANSKMSNGGQRKTT